MGRSGTELLRYGGDGHILTFAPTGAGKGVSVVVPNLLTYRGSVVCIDPKGAIAAVTAKARRAMGHNVVLLDPFDEVKRATQASGKPEAWLQIERASYNPFSHLRKTSLDAVDDVRLIVSSLILSESEKNRYFSDSARMILEALILHLLAENDVVTFDDLFPVAFDTRENFTKYHLRDMRKSKAFEGHVSHLAGQIENLTGDAGASVWSTLYRSLNLVKSPRLLPAMQPSYVDFRALKTTKQGDKPTTVYLVLPARQLETHGVWLRLMLAVILSQLSDARRSDYPVLFMVDECAALGRLEILETAVGLMRGYGLKLWLIFQDLPQLKSIYGQRWGSFISNAGVKQFFNVNDLETADFVSKYLGEETRTVMSQSVNPADIAGGGNISVMRRALLTSDEVRRLNRAREILFFDGLKPIETQKLIYHSDAEFKNLFSDDPYFQKPKL